MDVTQELDQLRQSFAGCDTVAFTDLGSQMILCVSAENKVAREHLDGLGQSAQVLLDGGLASDAVPMMNNADGPQTTSILATVDDLRLFLRSAARPAEALAMICRPDVDLQAAMDAARETLERIVASDVDVGGGAS